jgi:hypothetical protein
MSSFLMNLARRAAGVQAGAEPRARTAPVFPAELAAGPNPAIDPPAFPFPARDAGEAALAEASPIAPSRLHPEADLAAPSSDRNNPSATLPGPLAHAHPANVEPLPDRRTDPSPRQPIKPPGPSDPIIASPSIGRKLSESPTPGVQAREQISTAAETWNEPDHGNPPFGTDETGESPRILVRPRPASSLLSLPESLAPSVSITKADAAPDAVQVKIGTVEVRLTNPPAPSRAVAPLPPQGPRGFGDYTLIRKYVSNPWG